MFFPSDLVVRMELHRGCEDESTVIFPAMHVVPLLALLYSSKGSANKIRS